MAHSNKRVVNLKTDVYAVKIVVNTEATYKDTECSLVLGALLDLKRCRFQLSKLISVLQVDRDRFPFRQGRRGEFQGQHFDLFITTSFMELPC